MTEEQRTTSVVWRALVVLLSALLAIGVIAPQATADPDDASPDELQQRIDDLVALRYQAEVSMQTAAEEYNYAQDLADRARERSDQLNEQLESSRAILETSRAELRKYAVSSYRSGQSTMPALEPLVSDGDFQSVLRSLEADSVVSGKVTRTVQRHHADLLYVSVVEERARVAQDEADRALDDAEEAYAEAGRVLDKANREIDDAYAERARLIHRLAERTQRSVDDVTEEQDEREANPPVDIIVNPSPQPTASAEPTSEPTPSASPSPTPTTSASPTPSPTPSATSTPTPTSSPSPSPTPSPSPSPTTPPPSGGDLGKGTSVGSAAQGQAAVAWAHTQLGKPYLLGGAGPNSYDCSGLTMRAWEHAGVNVTRTSRSQYQRVKKIEMSQMRPGDLVFWANNTNDPSTIRHVAIYIGNNQVIEAPSPGGVVRIVSLSGWRLNDMMQYAGRP